MSPENKRAWADCCIPLTGSVSQHTSKASLVQRLRFPLRLPVMVLRQEHGQAAAIGRVCQSAYEQSKPVSAVAVPTASSRDGLSAFPCWQPGNHTTPIPPPFMSAIICARRHRELILPSRDGLGEERGQAAAYHWPGLSAHEQSKPVSAVAVPTASSRDGLTEQHGQAAAYHWSGLSVSIRTKQACFSGCGSTASSRDGLSAFPC